MRTDENGKPCPATLREYRDYCQVFGGPDNPAVKWLEAKAAKDRDGLDAVVLAPDSQMRALLFPMLFPMLLLGELENLSD
jgi:hypothetical protein